jgi:hypothetical protein
VPASGVIQPKLSINAAEDVYEREADRVAEQAVAPPADGNKRSTGLVEHFTSRPTIRGELAGAGVDRVLADSGRPLDGPVITT